MFKFLIKISLTAFAFILFALPLFANAITASGPIVTCGRSGQPFCNLCDIPVLIKNLIDYMTFFVALPLAAVMFVVGGYFYLIAGGSPQKVSQAKTVFLTTLKGLGIVLLSWLFIAEVMVLLTGGTTTDARFAGLSRPWNQLESPASCPFGTPSVVIIPPGGSVCGNLICEAGENSANCAIDCGGGSQPTCDVNFGGVACVVGGNTNQSCSQACECDNSCGGGGTFGCNNNGQCVSMQGGSFFDDTCDNTCQPPACNLTISDCGSVPSGYHWTINTSPNVCACWLVADSWITCWDLSLCSGQWRCMPNGNANGCSPVGSCCEPGSLPQ